MHLGLIRVCACYQLFVLLYCRVVYFCNDVPYWPVEGQLGGFQILAVVNNVAVNTHIQFLYERKFSFLKDKY